MAHLLDGVLGWISGAPAILQFAISAVLAALTEEWASVAVFGLARSGNVAWPVAVGSVFCGTLGVNVGLWYAGRLAGLRALKWKMFASIPPLKLQKLHHHVRREGWIAVAISRFVPGTRIPVFVLAGILGMGARSYVATQVAATALWIGATLGLVHIAAGIVHGGGHLVAGVLGFLVLLALIAWRLRRR